MPHIHDKIDFTVEVFLVYKNKVLLRKHDKYKIWLSVGGHIELDEDPNHAAIREVKEEVGIDIKLFGNIKRTDKRPGYEELIPPNFLCRHKINDTHEHIVMTYFAKSPTNKISELNEHEKSDDCKWFTNKELDNLTEINESVRYYAKSALSKLSTK